MSILIFRFAFLSLLYKHSSRISVKQRLNKSTLTKHEKHMHLLGTVRINTRLSSYLLLLSVVSIIMPESFPFDEL